MGRLCRTLLRADKIIMTPQLLGSLRRALGRPDRDRKQRVSCQKRAALLVAGQHQLFTQDCPLNSKGATSVLKDPSNLQDSCVLLTACQSELGLRIEVLYLGSHMGFPGALRSAKTDPTLDVGRTLKTPEEPSSSWFTCLLILCLSHCHVSVKA